MSDNNSHVRHNHSHEIAHGHADVSSIGGRLIAGVMVNILIFIAQAIGGILANSLGLLSDAAHNLSDVVSLALSYAAHRAGRLPNTPLRTFAYKRVEVLVALFNSVSLIAVSVYIVIEGVKRLIDPSPVGGSVVMLIAGIGMVANMAAALLLKGNSENVNVRSAFLHLVADSVSSFGVVLGGLIVWRLGWNSADAIVSILLAFWMVKEAFSIVRTTTNILMEGTPDRIGFGEVAVAIGAEQGVESVHDLHIWSISSSEFALSAHLVVGDCFISEGAAIIASVKRMLQASFSIGHATLELEYVGGQCAVNTCFGPLCLGTAEPGKGTATGEETVGWRK